MGLPAGLLIFVGFLSLGASFILQLIVTLGVVAIKGVFFLRVDTGVDTGSAIRLIFGVFNQCATPLGTNAGSICSAAELGYKNSAADITGLEQILQQYFVKDLPYALVLQPISTGFTALAAGAAFLHLCTNTVLWPLSAIWASLLTMSALVIELVLFILARNDFRDFFAQSNSGNSAELGPAIWIQVAALPPAFFGFLMLAAGWWLKRDRSDNYYDRDDFEPARPAYREKDDYYYGGPPPVRAPSRQTRRSRYDEYDDYYDYEDSRVYGNVPRRASRRESMRSGYDRRSYDDRAARRSYVSERDPYGSRASLAPGPNAPYRGGRSRRYSERGAY